MSQQVGLKKMAKEFKSPEYDNFDGLDKNLIRNPDLKQDLQDSVNFEQQYESIPTDSLETGNFGQNTYTFPQSSKLVLDKLSLSGYKLKNNSGSTRSRGDVVILDTSNDMNYTTTTSNNSANVLGVVAETTQNGQLGLVQVFGICQINCTTGGVNRGDFLVTSTTAGQAIATSGAQQNIIGQALSAKAAGAAGLVYCRLFSNTQTS